MRSGYLIVGVHVFVYLTSIIMSFILYLPGTPGSSLKSTMYLTRLDLSSNLIDERSTENTLYSNPSADTFWIYPTSYCANVPTDEDNKFSILCSNYSATYKFNYYNQFPLANENCTEKDFKAFNRDSTTFSNCLLAFLIVNCLWIFWVAILFTFGLEIMVILIAATSFTRFILIILITSFLTKPQSHLARLSEMCFEGQIDVSGPTSAYKGLVYFLIVLISLEWGIFFKSDLAWGIFVFCFFPIMIFYTASFISLESCFMNFHLFASGTLFYIHSFQFLGNNIANWWA